MQVLETTLAPSLMGLIEAIQHNPNLTPAKAKELVVNANIQAEDLMPFADFDHPLEDGYGRKMIYDAGKFELMVMSWNPGDFSSVHDHGYTQWGVVQIFGTAQHNIYSVKHGKLHLAKQEILLPHQAIKVNNPLIHQMGNPTSKPYLTLHLYGSNEREEAVTADSKIYELENQRIIHTTGGAFHNLPEEQVYDFESCPTPTRETFLYYSSLLLAYYNRLERCREIEDKKKALLEQIRKWSLMPESMN